MSFRPVAIPRVPATSTSTVALPGAQWGPIVRRMWARIEPDPPRRGAVATVVVGIVWTPPLRPADLGIPVLRLVGRPAGAADAQPLSDWMTTGRIVRTHHGPPSPNTNTTRQMIRWRIGPTVPGGTVWLQVMVRDPVSHAPLAGTQLRVVVPG